MSNNETESAQQQMVELQPLLSSQEQHVEDEVTRDIKQRIQLCEDRFLLPDCCIYRVPVMLRHLKEEVYTPKVISIGPFHYGVKRLQDMEKHKQILFKRFIDRATSSLDNLVCLVKDLEPKVRASYLGTIRFTKRQLVDLTLTDAGCIIQLFIMSYRHGKDDDAKLSQPWLDDSIQRDLLLLDNQLPFFIIKELFNKAFPIGHHGSLPSILRLTYNYFRYFNIQNLEPNPNVKINFTNLLRLFYLQGKMSERRSFSREAAGGFILLYNANALQEAGVKLMAGTSKCPLDLKLSGNILEIPHILMEDGVELLFHNMIALEACYYPLASYIIDYALPWDSLVETLKDVDLLIHKKIITNFLGDTNNVALLFNGLGKDVFQVNFSSQYMDIFQRLNGYCEDPWNKMRATLRRDYCNTPWHTVASIAGIILLTLTIVQTIFSILQVVLKK